MVLNGHIFSKSEWRTIVWERMWALEDEECNPFKQQLSNEKTLFKVIGKPFYLTWWILSDMKLCPIQQCESMARMVCDSSLLKSHDLRLKNQPLSTKFCHRCDLAVVEDTFHLVMQCPFYEESIKTMYNELESRNVTEIDHLLMRNHEVFYYLMGKHPDDVSFEIMTVVWAISARHISKIYLSAISGR